MHLDYRVPNIWYRARLVSTRARGACARTGALSSAPPARYFDAAAGSGAPTQPLPSLHT
jgi:hypothetical protein